MTRKENLLAAINRETPEWVPNGMENVIRIYPPIIERPLWKGKDVFGCDWDLKPGAEGGSFSTHSDPVIPELANWKETLKIPDVEYFDWEYAVEQVKNINRDEILLEGFCEMGLFERSYLLLGMEQALVSYMLEPELMNELLGALADYKIAFISKFHEMVGLDIIWYGDDWGTQRNLFVPEETWRNTIKVHTQRIYDCMKERGLIINQHSCGKIDGIFEDVVDMGANIWNMCQPCNDLKSLKDNFGDRISFHGGIDSQFVLNKPDATADEIRAEIRKRISEMAHGGGYIAGPSHTVPSHRPDLMEVYNEEITKFGGSFYS